MGKRNFPEHDLQRAIVTRLEYTRLLFMHAPNGRHAGSAKKAGIWKSLGVKAGVPDLLIFNCFELDHLHYAGLAMELKIGSRSPTPQQREWLDGLRAQGWRCEVVRTVDQAHQLLAECYGI